MHRILPLMLLAVYICACAPTIKTQAIPVSSNPMGAQVNANGKQHCTTPCSLDLACTQDHILTITKPGFKQQDVVIKRQYQREKVLLNAINSGINSGTFFNDAAWGINSGVQSINHQEATGEAYKLVPNTVSIRLIPDGGFVSTTTPAEADQAMTHAAAAAPLSLMDVQDEQMLENCLEYTASGKTTAWTNERSGIKFAVIAQDAFQQGGQLVRNFSVATHLKGQQSYRNYQAYRVGRGEWQVAMDEDEPKRQGAASEINSKAVLQTLGNVNWPKYETSKTVNASSKSATRHNSDGSITTQTSSSSTSVGVSVGPGAIFKLLDALNNGN